MSTGTSVLREVLGKIIGTDRTEHLFKLLVIHPEIAAAPGPQVSRCLKLYRELMELSLLVG